MIPIRDSLPAERTPWINWLLIAANVAAFLYELRLGGELPGFLQQHGMVPARVLHHETWALVGVERQVAPLVTHMFLHGGWLHLIGNMWFLHVFGDSVEGRFGHFNYLLFYLACGFAAAGGQIAADPASYLPMVGASGAVAGVLGAYFVLFPRSRVLTLIPIFIFLQWIELPAYFFLGFWALIQFFRGTAELVGGATAGVAFWAHVAGFVAGAVYLLLRPDLRAGSRTVRPRRGRG